MYAFILLLAPSLLTVNQYFNSIDSDNASSAILGFVMAVGVTIGFAQQFYSFVFKNTRGKHLLFLVFFGLPIVLQFLILFIK